MITDKALEMRARRAAKRVGLFAQKGRSKAWHAKDQGGFRLVDARTNVIVAGENFDMTEQDVIEYCVTNMTYAAQAA